MTMSSFKIKTVDLLKPNVLCSAKCLSMQAVISSKILVNIKAKLHLPDILLNSTSLPVTLAGSLIIHKSENGKKNPIYIPATNSFNDHRSNVNSIEPVD